VREGSPWRAGVRPATGTADFKEIACRLDHLESENAGILERLETRGKGRRDWINLLISTSRHRRTCSSAQNIRQG
jgi:hypothetical protein